MRSFKLGLLLMLVLAGFLPARAVTVTPIGHTSSSANPQTITVTNGVVQGHGIVIAFVGGAAAGTLTCSDSVGNTYTSGESVYNTIGFGATRNFGFCSGAITTAIPANGTITVQYSTGLGLGFSAYDVSNFASSSWVDKSCGADSTGTFSNPVTCSTPATTNPTDVVFISVGNGASATISGFTGFAMLDTSLNVQGSANSFIWVGWKEVTVTGVQGGLTLTSNAANLVPSLVAAYKEGGAAPACTNRIALLGAGCA